MVEIVVAQSGTQTPLWVQIAPAVVGILGLLGAVYVAYRNIRAEHLRWLRQERMKAYTEFIAAAEAAADLLWGMKADLDLQTGLSEEGEPPVIRIGRRAQELSAKLPINAIILLGPDRVADSASRVRGALGWKPRQRQSEPDFYSVLQRLVEWGDIRWLRVM